MAVEVVGVAVLGVEAAVLEPAAVAVTGPDTAEEMAAQWERGTAEEMAVQWERGIAAMVLHFRPAAATRTVRCRDRVKAKRLPSRLPNIRGRIGILLPGPLRMRRRFKGKRRDLLMDFHLDSSRKSTEARVCLRVGNQRSGQEQC
jgi:hypothetical protein